MRVIILVSFMFCSSLAFSLDCDHIYDDKIGRLHFGSLAVDQEIKTPPKKMTKSESCHEDEANNYINCQYTDSNGVSYSVVDNHVIRKQILAPSKYRGTLPLKIKSTDSIKQVLQKIGKFPKLRSLIHVDESPEGIIIGTSDCIRDSTGTIYGFYVVFENEKKMKYISAEIVWN